MANHDEQIHIDADQVFTVFRDGGSVDVHVQDGYYELSVMDQARLWNLLYRATEARSGEPDTTIDVENCARCGESHPVEPRGYQQNAPDDADWWAVCPVLGEPILIEVEGDDG